MLCKCHWIVLYTVHFTAFCLGGPFFPGHGVYGRIIDLRPIVRNHHSLILQGGELINQDSHIVYHIFI